MNNTTVAIKCVGEIDVKTLQDLVAVYLPAAEEVEFSLQSIGKLDFNDEILWNLEVEGPEWDYIAKGTVTHSRGPVTISCHEVSIHGSAVALSSCG